MSVHVVRYGPSTKAGGPGAGVASEKKRIVLIYAADGPAAVEDEQSDGPGTWSADNPG